MSTITAVVILSLLFSCTGTDGQHFDDDTERLREKVQDQVRLSKKAISILDGVKEYLDKYYNIVKEDSEYEDYIERARNCLEEIGKLKQDLDSMPTKDKIAYSPDEKVCLQNTVKNYTEWLERVTRTIGEVEALLKHYSSFSEDNRFRNHLQEITEMQGEILYSFYA